MVNKLKRNYMNQNLSKKATVHRSFMKFNE